VALDPPAPLTCEEPEPLIQMTGHVDRTHRHRPSRRELDRQRDPVHPAAHLRRSTPLLAVPVQDGARLPSPLTKQLHGRALLYLPPGRGFRRCRHGTQPHHLLARHIKPLAAGRQHRHPWRSTQHIRREAGNVVEEMLAVVQH
jgi:hypothetical protein